MALSRNDSYRQLLGREAPLLHPNSPTFGSTDPEVLERSVRNVARNFRSYLLHLNASLRSGAIDLPQYTMEARAAVRAAYFVIYAAGAVSVFPFYTLTERDTRILDEALDTETGHLSLLGSGVLRGNRDFDLPRRIWLHLLALRAIFERGRLEAMPSLPLRWRLGITDHCKLCQAAAANGPYQLDSTSGLGLPILPGIPGDGKVCLGLGFCGCTIEQESGIPLPNQELADHLREVLLEVVHAANPDAS